MERLLGQAGLRRESILRINCSFPLGRQLSALAQQKENTGVLAEHLFHEFRVRWDLSGARGTPSN